MDVEDEISLGRGTSRSKCRKRPFGLGSYYGEIVIGTNS